MSVILADTIGRSTYGTSFACGFSLTQAGRRTPVPIDDLDESAAIPPIPCMVGGRVVEDPIFHRLSRELAYARVRAHLLQRVVAKRMGTTTSAISRLENAFGHRPTLTTLERYAEAVGCELQIRLVHPHEAHYRELSALARNCIREPHERFDG